MFEGGAPADAAGPALQPFVAPFHLPREQFDALVDGVAMDATPRRYETFADLEPYCHRVASAVGLMCAEIFGYRERARARLRARSRRRAAAHEHPARRRRRLPPRALLSAAGGLARFGCTEADIAREVEHSGDGVQIAARARAARTPGGARARVLRPRGAARCRSRTRRRFIAAEIMRAIYWELLRRIEAAEFRRVLRRDPRAATRAGAARAQAWWRLRAMRAAG